MTKKSKPSLLKITKACLDLVSKRSKSKLDHDSESQTDFMSQNGIGREKKPGLGEPITPSYLDQLKPVVK